MSLEQGRLRAGFEARLRALLTPSDHPEPPFAPKRRCFGVLARPERVLARKEPSKRGRLPALLSQNRVEVTGVEPPAAANATPQSASLLSPNKARPILAAAARCIVGVTWL